MKITNCRKHNKKNEIIAESINCIERYGVEGFSIRSVSKSLGCATGLINLYFGNKDELLKQVYIDSIAKLELDIVTVSQDNKIDFQQKLSNIVDIYFGNEMDIVKTFNTWTAFWLLGRTHTKLGEARISHNIKIRKCLKAIFSDNRIFNDNGADYADEFISLMDGLWLEIGLGNQSITLSRSKIIMNEWIKKNIFYLTRGN